MAEVVGSVQSQGRTTLRLIGGRRALTLESENDKITYQVNCESESENYKNTL